MASQEGHTELVGMLLSSGADPNLATKVYRLIWCVHCPMSILGSAEIAFLTQCYLYGPYQLVNSGVGIELSASTHSSTPNLLMQNAQSVPLGKAAENGHTQTVKRLLERGANRNHQDKVNMYTKLHSSSSQGVAHGLTLHVSLPCVQFGNTALYYASRNMHADVVSLLLQDHADDHIHTEVYI